MAQGSNKCFFPIKGSGIICCPLSPHTRSEVIIFMWVSACVRVCVCVCLPQHIKVRLPKQTQVCLRRCTWNKLQIKGEAWEFLISNLEDGEIHCWEVYTIWYVWLGKKLLYKIIIKKDFENNNYSECFYALNFHEHIYVQRCVSAILFSILKLQNNNSNNSNNANKNQCCCQSFTYTRLL